MNNQVNHHYGLNPNQLAHNPGYLNQNAQTVQNPSMPVNNQRAYSQNYTDSNSALQQPVDPMYQQPHYAPEQTDNSNMYRSNYGQPAGYNYPNATQSNITQTNANTYPGNVQQSYPNDPSMSYGQPTYPPNNYTPQAPAQPEYMYNNAPMDQINNNLQPMPNNQGNMFDVSSRQNNNVPAGIINNGAHFARPIFSVMPRTISTKSIAGLDLGIIYKLYDKDVQLPQVQTGPSMPIVRCSHCRAYINCYCIFVEGGNSWKCSLCNTMNAVTPEYYSPLGMNGLRLDRSSRNELLYTAVEFLATQDYMSKQPMAPTVLVALDISVHSLRSSFAQVICTLLKNLITSKEIIGYDRMMFGLITYDTSLHFYNVKENGKISMNIVNCNQNDQFLPRNDILWNLKDDSQAICSILSQLPFFWQNTDCETSFLSRAVDAAKLILENTGGKLILCHASPLEDPMFLQQPSKGSSSNKGETSILNTQTVFYQSRIPILAQAHISIDIIYGPSKATNPNLSCLANFTNELSGTFRYYPHFDAKLYYDQMKIEFYKVLSNNTGWEAALRARLSEGWITKAYYGNCQLKGSELICYSSFNDETSLIVGFDMVETTSTNTDFFCQLAILYTSSDGRRLIRVITTLLPTSNNIAEVALSVDPMAYIHFLTIKHMNEAIKTQLADGRANFIASVRKLISSLSTCMPMVPPFIDGITQIDENNLVHVITSLCNSVCKSSLFVETREIEIDERIYTWSKVRTLSLDKLTYFYKPVMYDITNLQIHNDELVNLQLCPLTQRILNPSHVYLVISEFNIRVWIGFDVPVDWLNQTFGVSNFENIHVYSFAFMPNVTPTARPTLKLINYLKNEASIYSCPMIAVQGSPYESYFLRCLTDDKTSNCNLSLVDLWTKFCMQNTMHSQPTITPPIDNRQYNYSPPAMGYN